MNATAEAPAAEITTDAPPPVRKPSLPALTGVRTILALNIVFFHFTPPHMGPLYPLINSSFVFVGFFFLLSGYVLAYNYADRPTLDSRRFWIARFSRFYPIYLVSLAFSLRMLLDEWQVRSHTQFWSGVVMTPLLLQGWNQSLATFWNTVAWTLSAEVLLYAGFPWFVRLPWPRSPVKLVAMLLGLWAIGLIPHTIYLLTNPDHLAVPANRYSSGPWLRTLKYTPVAYVCTFLAGMTLAKLQGALRISDRVRTVLAGLSLALLVTFFAGAVVNRVPYILLHGGLLVPLFSLLVLGLSGKNIFASAFSIRPIVFLGQTTFALYLLHFNTMNLLRRYHVTDRLHLAAFDPWISYAAVMVLAAAATFWVERPARRWILARAGA